MNGSNIDVNNPAVDINGDLNVPYHLWQPLAYDSELLTWCRTGNLSKVQQLYTAYPDLRCIQNRVPFVHACEYSQTKVALYLLDIAQPSAKTINEGMRNATAARNVTIVRHLIAAGANNYKMSSSDLVWLLEHQLITDFAIVQSNDEPLAAKIHQFRTRIQSSDCGLLSDLLTIVSHYSLV